MSANYVAELRVGNKYRLGRKIGSGSFGDIYLGERGGEERGRGGQCSSLGTRRGRRLVPSPARPSARTTGWAARSDGPACWARPDGVQAGLPAGPDTPFDGRAGVHIQTGEEVGIKLVRGLHTSPGRPPSCGAQAVRAASRGRPPAGPDFGRCGAPLSPDPQENTKTRHPQLLYEFKLYKILQGGSASRAVLWACAASPPDTPAPQPGCPTCGGTAWRGTTTSW